MASAGVILDGAQALRPLKTYSVHFTATSNAATQNLGSQLVRIHTTGACCIDLENGAAGTATSFPMAADQTEYFRAAITGTPIHVIGNGATGQLYITEC